MSLLLHCADISHPGKPWKSHKKFADSILQEFFLQGDEEAKLGLPFSPLCDRNNVLVPESQISFIEFIVEPSLSILSDLVDFVLKGDEQPLGLAGDYSSGTTSSSAPGGGSTSNINNSNRKPIGNAAAGGPARRTESERNLRKDQLQHGNKVGLSSRTPSFPLQSGQQYGASTRPWINHLVENKAKWRMISAGKLANLSFLGLL